MRLSDYINDAHILASDSPYEVVCKLQRAIDARHFKDDDPMPRLDHNWMTGEPAASPEEIAEWWARQDEKRRLDWTEEHRAT